MKRILTKALILLLAAALLLCLAACQPEEEVDTSVCYVCGAEATHELEGRGYCDQHYMEFMRDLIKHAGWF